MTRTVASAIMECELNACKGDRGDRAGSVYLADTTGDTCLATFKQGDVETSQAADVVIRDFLARSKERWGSAGTAFFRPLDGPADANLQSFDPERDSIVNAREVMLMDPLAGG